MKDHVKLIIVIVIIILISVGGYFGYEKFANKEKDKPTPVDNGGKEEKYSSEWINHVLKQDIKIINIGYSIPSGETVECFEKELTKEQLKTILEKMTEAKPVKKDIGGENTECNYEGIRIEYQDYRVEIFKNKYVVVDSDMDPEVLELLEKEKNSEEATSKENPWWAFEYNWDSSYINSLIN